MSVGCVITRGHGRADSSGLGTRESLPAASLGELPPSQENMFEQWLCLIEQVSLG